MQPVPASGQVRKRALGGNTRPDSTSLISGFSVWLPPPTAAFIDGYSWMTIYQLSLCTVPASFIYILGKKAFIFSLLLAELIPLPSRPSTTLNCFILTNFNIAICKIFIKNAFTVIHFIPTLCSSGKQLETNVSINQLTILLFCLHGRHIFKNSPQPITGQRRNENRKILWRKLKIVQKQGST